MKPMLRIWFLIVLTVTLFACSGGGSSGGAGGGGGGGAGDPGSQSPPATAPTLALTLQSVKTFHFTWTDVSGETEYRLFEKTSADADYTQVATTAENSTSYDHVVFLPSRADASYILKACNAGGCVSSDPVSVSGTMTEAIGYIKASNTSSGAAFGTGVALSSDGTTLAVGAYMEGTSGAVYVFTRSGTTWSQQAYIKASNAENGDVFGTSVALSSDGTTLAVGAPGEDSNATGINGNQADNNAQASGAVYVFKRSGTTWSQQAYVKASNAEWGDYFGTSVALSSDGTTLAVGAQFEDSNATGINGNQASNSVPSSGAVYVFTRSGTTWSQQAYVKASNTYFDAYFGNSVALSSDGTTLAVGAPDEGSNATGINGNQADNSATNAGAVYVFTRSGTTWSQQAYVKASNTDAGDYFGASVALSSDGATLAVSASGEDSNATGVNGNQADNSASGAGAVYVFTRSGTTWSQQAYVKASNAGSGAGFGSGSISLASSGFLALSSDGSTLAVAAIYESGSATGIDGDQADNSAVVAGAVYVFTRNGIVWSQQAYVKASNTDPGDYFGTAVALSSDGSTLAVSASGESSSATGINGNQADNSATNAGAVYVY